VLVAGIGNIFLGDDAFGVEVAQRLARREQRPGVRVVDFGIRGFDLAYALLAEDQVTILVDALPRGDAPGTLCVLEPDLAELADGSVPPSIEPHGMDPVRVLRLALALGGQPGRVLVVGCEPATVEPSEDGSMELSPPVEAAVEEAIRMVESLVEELLSATVKERA
jgi:hydrogenase maturation protease